MHGFHIKAIQKSHYYYFISSPYLSSDLHESDGVVIDRATVKQLFRPASKDAKILLSDRNFYFFF